MRTDRRTDHPILIFRPPFLLTSSSTTVQPPSYAQTFVVVSSLSPCPILTIETGDSPKLWYLYSTWHGVVSKKTGIIGTTMETSSPVRQSEYLLLYEDSALLLKTCCHVWLVNYANFHLRDSTFVPFLPSASRTALDLTMEHSVRTPISGWRGPGFKSQAGQRLS
jgi:hypothetical protein